MNYVEEFCDEIAILNEGKIVLNGNIKAIQRSYDRSTVVVSGERPDAIAAYASERLAKLVKTAQVEDGAARILLKDTAMRPPFLPR
jgi:ABC-2 type transport system ATP-binding protein